MKILGQISVEINTLYTTSSGTTITLPTEITFAFAEVRPGRYIELNNTAQFEISGVDCFGAGTAIRLIDSAGTFIDNSYANGATPDMNATFLDLQGASEDILVQGSGAIGIYTFINNNASAAAVALSSNLALTGCSSSAVSGGTLINQTGIGMHVTGCNFSQGLINIQTTSPVSFSATQFSEGGTNSTPTQFAYGAGVSDATFDPSCQNAPS
jgi:hypothetical protein